MLEYRHILFYTKKKKDSVAALTSPRAKTIQVCWWGSGRARSSGGAGGALEVGHITQELKKKKSGEKFPSALRPFWQNKSPQSFKIL